MDAVPVTCENHVRHRLIAISCKIAVRRHLGKPFSL